MEFLTELIAQHAHRAHWIIFCAIILAGFNVPISADVLILLSAVIAATILPENTWALYFSALFGCYFSAWGAYWLGRLVGPKLSHLPFFKKLLSQDRLERVKKFYDHYGLWTLLIGRFIPFGVRNCIFMSTGMSKMSFLKFIVRDALACSIWTSSCFYLFYKTSQNYQLLWHYLKTFNLVIFAAFGVTVIGFIWYKIRKKAQSIPHV
jgi:membrane protein DedA with SNARE-associated domain